MFASAPDGTPPDGRRYGTTTPWSTFGGCVGSSSLACVTPGGGIVSITFGTVSGLAPQIGFGSPAAAHTPNWKSCGVGANVRAWSALKPS